MTPGRPSPRSRSTISPAALSVKVTTSTWSASTAPVPIAYAVRRLITRVLPVPAAAWIGDRPFDRDDGLALGLVQVVEQPSGVKVLRRLLAAVGTRRV